MWQKIIKINQKIKIPFQLKLILSPYALDVAVETVPSAFKRWEAHLTNLITAVLKP